MTSSVTGTLVAWEFRYFFLNTRQVIFLPLLLAAVLLTMWPSIGSPYVPVFLVVFLGTEREYNNTLNRWPAQLAAMILLPVDWPGAVRAKNLTTILITLVVTMCASIVVLYFAPGIPSAEHTLLALLYLLSVIFPLLSAGNARSIHSPRPGAAVRSGRPSRGGDQPGHAGYRIHPLRHPLGDPGVSHPDLPLHRGNDTVLDPGLRAEDGCSSCFLHRPRESDRVNAIELSNLTKTYESGRRALDGLTMAVPEGSLFGFIGLNGAGKTSTIRILAGLLRPEAGSVRLFDRDVLPRDQWHKSEMGFVLDRPVYFPWMTGREYLDFVGRIHGLQASEGERRTGELLEFLDLEEQADDTIASYSTGMGKKISLAAAIIHRPRLVILDEPLEGIDALTAAAIKETLSRITVVGSTVLITSHVLETIEKLCTEIALIHHGKVLLQSSTATIHQQAEALIGDRRFSSLEELFLGLVSDRQRTRHLSFLEG